jgi:hypothetical protein
MISTIRSDVMDQQGVPNMLILSGYTMGFFFPKQARRPATPTTNAELESLAERPNRDLSETRPDADSESREVPAAFYFYRYF